MEKVFKFSQSTEKLVEKVLDDDAVMLNHIILNYDEALPQHNSNSDVYMIIIRGTLSIQLEDEPSKSYEHGNIINIPYGVKMNISNSSSEQVEFFVVKAPSPRVYQQ